MAQVIKLKRTLTPDNPPAALEVGEPAVGLGDYPVRMWIGMPDGSVQELFAGTAIEDAENDWVYGRSNGDWVKIVIADDTPPAAPAAGVLWWDTAGAQLYGWTGEQWVVAVNLRGVEGPRGPRGEKGDTGEKGEQGVPGMFEGRALESTLYRHNSTTLRMTPGFIQINGEMHRMPANGDIMAWNNGAWVDGVPDQALLPSTTYLVFAKYDDDEARAIASFRSEVGHRASAVQGNEGVEVLAPLTGAFDPFWHEVVLCTDGLVDLSRRNHTLALAGGVTPVSIPAPEQPASGTFGQVIDFPGPSWGRIMVITATDFAFGNNDFCIEAYIRPSRLNAMQALFSDGNQTAFMSWIASDNTLRAQFAGWGAGWQFSGTVGPTFTANEWQHVAIYRNGAEFFGARNGVVTRIGDVTPWGANAPIGPVPPDIRIGTHQDGSSWPFLGQMAGIRITKGRSRYGASNFTPPPPPYPTTDRRIVGAEDPSESLIGIVRTDAARQFVDDPKRRFVRSWRRDQGRDLFGQFAAQRQTFFQFWNEINREIRVEWVSFDNEAIDLTFQAALLGGAGVYGGISLGIDSVAVPLEPELIQYMDAGAWRGHSMRYVVRLNEGHHFATVICVSSNGNWLNFGVPQSNPWINNTAPYFAAMPALTALIGPRS